MPKYIRILVKNFWRIFAVMLIASAVLVQLGRELSPLVGDYRDSFSTYLSETLGVNVTIDALQAQWSGLTPQLRLSGLQLSSDDDVAILSIREATAELGLLRSLWQWELAWGQVSLADIEASFIQAEDGGWGIAGLAQTTAADTSATIDDPLDVFLLGRHIEIHRAMLRFEFVTGHETEVEVPHILLENSRTFHRLTAGLTLDGRADTARLVLEGRGDPRDKDSFQARGYLKLHSFPLEKPVAALARQVWQNLPDGQWREGHTLDLEMWIETAGGGGYDLQGLINIDGVPWAPTSYPDGPTEPGLDLPQHLSSAVTGRWTGAGGWRLALQDAQLAWPGNRSPNFNLVVSAGPDQSLNVQTDKLVLADWLALASRHGYLRGRLAQVLETLEPRGALHHVQLQLDLGGDATDFTLKANLGQVSVAAWQGAPALEQVDGYIEAGKRGGVVELDARQGFSMHYPTIYTEPLAYQSAHGQVAWQLRPENNSIYINSGPLAMRGDDGLVNGYFHIYLPWEKDTAPSNMTLVIGLQNSEAKYHKKYVPFTVAEPLREWLDRSLGSGRIEQGGFIYQGSLAKGKGAGRALQLYLDIKDATLNYHPDWPALTEVDAVLNMNDLKVDVAVQEARLYGSRLGPTLVAVAPNPMGQGSLLGVKGTVVGDAADGLRVLRESMIRRYVDDSFDQWRMQGDMRADITLSIPLVAGEPGELHQVRVDLADTDLSMDELKLGFTGLQGRINYSSVDGIKAQKVSGVLWDKPVSLSIENPANADGGRDTVVDLRGSVATETLAHWSRTPELLFTEGDLPYLARLRIPPRDADRDYDALLNVSSNMQGVAVDLPAPYGKPADTARPLQVLIPIRDGESRYDVRYGELAHGLFLESGGRIVKGAVGLGSKAVLPAAAGTLALTGRAGEVIFDEWAEVIERYQVYESQIAALDQAGEEGGAKQQAQAITTEVDLLIGNLRLSDLELEALRVSGKSQTDGWRLKLANQTLAGNLGWYGDERPLALELEYLRLPAAEDEGETQSDAETTRSDPLAGWNLDEAIAVDFSTREFSIGTDDYGSWSFLLRPRDNGVLVSDLRASVRGADIRGMQDNTGARLLWQRRDGGHVSQFSGRLMAADLGAVLQQWQQPKLIESTSAVFEMDFEWPGSPAALGIKELSGKLRSKLTKGRFISGGGTGNNPLLRLLGLFNFDTWARRLKLDFSDLLKDGMAYDEISSEMEFDQGTVYLLEPMRVKTPSSKLQMAGTIDLDHEQLDATLVATLPVGGNLTLLAAFAAGLPAAAGVYVASKIFKKQVDKVASVSYSMSGDWGDPKFQFERLFDDKAAKRAGEDTRKEAETNGQTPPAQTEQREGSS
ncbi:TIGR02099 family protein [Exilibacterium tricleocarpae]|uniref:TIGR02099 family protein n=1 Tax=Exilibacterium tricleocarpae TaxID=2591008 RepID=A0A545TSG2_9GAMM|nr:YhdP family protein [Exilibacterium tricleocarpae]TQV80164.1 TIGR02099 family protein [Exilibacterium tricleocarpae]